MHPMFLASLDILVVVTLLYAIYYMRIVARSILVIRQGKSEMQQVLKEMTGAIHKADEAIQGMKRLADDKGRILQKHIDGATNVTEELKFIMQAADTVAQRIEKGTVTTKPEQAKPAAAKPAGLKPDMLASGMSKAEKDLAAALAKRKSEAG